MAEVELKLVTLVTAASEEDIRRANQPLDALDLKIEGQDAVREYLAQQPPVPMPKGIQVIIPPKKPN